MPWLETEPMSQRSQFIDDVQRAHLSVTELCARYGISRKTGYKWLARYDAAGRPGLVDRSRAPHHCPHRIAEAVADLICATRDTHPDWGAQTLLDWLAPRHPDILAWPAISTAADLLDRRGKVTKRRRRRASQHPGVVPPATTAPNDLWTTDFKGQFHTGDGARCYPLTLVDHHTRLLLRCTGLASTRTLTARPVFEHAFREFGLPRAMRSDNGVPFATASLHGLSQLSVWWMRLGIQVQRSRPGCPQDNGAHERLHRTLKRHAIRPARATMRAQQRAFDAFRQEYNTERPHRYLGGTPPAAHYTSSLRPYSARLPPATYPGHFTVKRVTTGGTIRFRDRLLFLAKPLIGEVVGLDEIGDGVWAIYFTTVLLATVDERDFRIHE
jgi:transposase InsO family protein